MTRHEELQKTLSEEERKQALPNNIKGWNELMEESSGIKVDKFQLKIADIAVFEKPERNFNGNDRDLLELIIEFED